MLRKIFGFFFLIVSENNDMIKMFGKCCVRQVNAVCQKLDVEYDKQQLQEYADCLPSGGVIFEYSYILFYITIYFFLFVLIASPFFVYKIMISNLESIRIFVARIKIILLEYNELIILIIGIVAWILLLIVICLTLLMTKLIQEGKKFIELYYNTWIEEEYFKNLNLEHFPISRVSLWLVNHELFFIFHGVFNFFILLPSFAIIKFLAYHIYWVKTESIEILAEQIGININNANRNNENENMNDENTVAIERNKKVQKIRSAKIFLFFIMADILFVIHNVISLYYLYFFYKIGPFITMLVEIEEIIFDQSLKKEDLTYMIEIILAKYDL